MEDLDLNFVPNHNLQWIRVSCTIAMSLLSQKRLLYLFHYKMTVMALVNNLIQKNGFSTRSNSHD